MSHNNLHELYACNNESGNKYNLKKLEQQLGWQQNIIELSTPLIKLNPGDVINLDNTVDKRLQAHYRIMSLNIYCCELNSTKTEKETQPSYQRIIAMPIDIKFSPLHKINQTHKNKSQLFNQTYKLANPPLMLANIDGYET